jgi:hypothetical protein
MSRVVDLEALSQDLGESLRKDFPLVRRVVLEEGSDSTGDAALFVWVLLDDNVRDEDLSWSAIKPLTERAEEMARALMLGWPYARVRRVREWDERNLSEEEISEAEAR